MYVLVRSFEQFVMALLTEEAHQQNLIKQFGKLKRKEGKETGSCEATALSLASGLDLNVLSFC